MDNIQKIMQEMGYEYCKDHDTYFPDKHPYCPACQVATVEAYLDKLVGVRDHYRKIRDDWAPPNFKITQKMADKTIPTTGEHHTGGATHASEKIFIDELAEDVVDEAVNSVLDDELDTLPKPEDHKRDIFKK